MLFREPLADRISDNHSVRLFAIPARRDYIKTENALAQQAVVAESFNHLEGGGSRQDDENRGEDKDDERCH